MGGLGNPSTWLSTIGGGGVIIPADGLDFLTGKAVPFVVDFLLLAVVALSLIFSLIGGIMLITSAGNKEAMAKAKTTITYAIFGLVLGAGSFIFLHVLGQIFKSNLLK